MKPIPKLHEYYRIKMVQSEFIIEFETLKEMARYAEKNSIKSVFILTEEDGKTESFAFSNKGGLLKHTTNGYQTLEDFRNADLNCFPDATVYYAAMQLGFNKYDEYKMSSETGITDAKEYEEIKKAGYIQAYSQFDEFRKSNAESLQFAEIKNPYDLKEWVGKKKFQNIAEFMQAFQGGFADPLNYRAAIEKGYKTAADSQKGTAKGFLMGENYYYAQQRGIETFEEMVLYNDLQQLPLPDLTFDQRIICVLLSKATDGKKTSVNKLYEGLEETKKIYVKKDGTIPQWFTMAIQSVKDLVAFLLQNELIKHYGHYDADGEFFQKKKMQERTVILDGSNVAYGVTGDKNRKPTMKNILIMVQFLKEKGFLDISVYTDASLKHRMADMSLLPEVEKLCKYRYTPAEKPADLFLLSHVKQNHCLLVSNDMFRDWKLADPWIAVNIDYYLLKFMIEDDKVNMPDLV